MLALTGSEKAATVKALLTLSVVRPRRLFLRVVVLKRSLQSQPSNSFPPAEHPKLMSAVNRSSVSCTQQSTLKKALEAQSSAAEASAPTAALNVCM